ncbi:MAG: hypothetical protein JW821_00650 [Deltaproteobacteria bacterium]|nr:hypothetical protein [Deltaproteobacteria bacterium]
MGNRHRNMYYATGLPGWMRFGYSPGWGGLPPGATYLTTGRWPTPQAEAAWQSGRGQPGQMGPGYAPGGAGYAAPPEQELDFLKQQASVLRQQMDQILKRIDEIEKREEK